jgi:hypothetical protein
MCTLPLHPSELTHCPALQRHCGFAVIYAARRQGNDETVRILVGCDDVVAVESVEDMGGQTSLGLERPTFRWCVMQACKIVKDGSSLCTDSHCKHASREALCGG